MHAVSSSQTLSATNFAHSMFVLLYSCHHVAHRFYYFDVSGTVWLSYSSFTPKKGQQKESKVKQSRKKQQGIKNKEGKLKQN